MGVPSFAKWSAPDGQLVLMDLGIVYLLGRSILSGTTFGRAIIIGGAMFFWLPNLYAATHVGRSCGTYSAFMMQQAEVVVVIKAAILIIALTARLDPTRSEGEPKASSSANVPPMRR